MTTTPPWIAISIQAGPGASAARYGARIPYTTITTVSRQTSQRTTVATQRHRMKLLSRRIQCSDIALAGCEPTSLRHECMVENLPPWTRIGPCAEYTSVSGLFHALTIDHRVIAHHGLVGARGRGTRPRNRPFSRSRRANALPEREKRSSAWRAVGPPNLPD